MRVSVTTLETDQSEPSLQSHDNVSANEKPAIVTPQYHQVMTNNNDNIDPLSSAGNNKTIK